MAQPTVPFESQKPDWLTAMQEPPLQKHIVGDLPDVPGPFGMIIGSIGSRKSWLALQIAVAVATGTPVAGGLWPAPQQGRAVYFSSQDSANALWRRLHHIGHLPGNEAIFEDGDQLDIIPLIAGEDGACLDDRRRFYPRSDDKALDSVDQVIAFCAGARLIIFDSLADMVSASDNDDVKAQELVQVVREIGHKTGAGIILVHHQGFFSTPIPKGIKRLMQASSWTVALEIMSGRTAKTFGVSDPLRWTTVHEVKASHMTLGRPRHLYHWPEFNNRQGEVTGGVPLFRDL
ncbi:MAG: AAA family ATPase [Ferrimicrobium acidiphilum]